MLYIYYMKIKTLLWLSALSVWIFVPCIQAQVVVVKQEANKVFLDTSEYNRTVSVGDQFKIIVSQEKLTNPKTGKELGLINHYSAEGKIIEVQPLYVIGQMPNNTKFSIGQEAIIQSAPVAAHVATPAAHSAAATENPAPVSNRKINTYTAVEREIVGAVQDDFTPRPGQEIATVDTKGNLILYAIDGNTLQEIASHPLTVGQKPLALSALDKMETGYAQLFVSVYNENEQKISTFVFDVQDQTFQPVATLPYFVKELGCGEEKELYAQKPFISGAKPSTTAHELDYENGQFKLNKDSFSTRSNWLSGVNRYEIQNKDTENLVYTASNRTLRLRLQNGKFVDSPALFATAPNRVKYKQQMIPFYPAVQVYGPEGRATLAAVENKTTLGLLSQQFGQYKGSKLHFLTYENGSLDVRETVELNGFLYDTSCTQRGILAPQVLSSRQTVITEIYR